MQNHAHDSIYGCCTDEAIHNIESRGRGALETTQIVIGRLLDRIAEGEEWLRDRLGAQTNIRLRVHQDIARIETDEKAMPELLRWREEAVQKLQKLGFSYVTLDLEGFRSGSMDRKIGKEKEQE